LNDSFKLQHLYIPPIRSIIFVSYITLSRAPNRQPFGAANPYFRYRVADRSAIAPVTDLGRVLMEKTANLIGRLALAYFFIQVGVSGALSGTGPHIGWMAFDALAIAGGLALLLGWHIRHMALALAALAVVAATIGHQDLGWLVALGLVLLATRDVCSLCLDNRLLRRR